LESWKILETIVMEDRVNVERFYSEKNNVEKFKERAKNYLQHQYYCDVQYKVYQDFGVHKGEKPLEIIQKYVNYISQNCHANSETVCIVMLGFIE